MHLVLLIACISIVVCSPISDKNDEKDGEMSRKILGSSVVTSVSVVMETGNGKHTYYSDSIGRPINKPHIASQVASPINLLNPDRYEFYTFNDNGELVKRLMTIDEIQGIIAGGDVDNLNYNNEYSQMLNPDNDVSDIVENVQNVLKEEIESHKYSPDTIPLLDTPDVSETWDTILPAVFGDNLAMPEIYDSTEKFKETTTLEKTTEDINIQTINKLSSLSSNNIQQYEDTNERNKITPPYFQPVSSIEKLQENISTTNIDLFTQPAEQNKINDSIVETIDLPKQTELVSIITRPVTQVTENIITTSSHFVTTNTIQNTTIKPTLNQVRISTPIVNIEELKNVPLLFSTTPQPILTTSQPISTTSQPISTTSQPISTTSQPISTTSRPISTTSQPISTTSQPISTTSQPISTTSQPISTTPQPITTTQLKSDEEQLSIITNTTRITPSNISASLTIELQPIENITEDLSSSETFMPSTNNINELNPNKLNTISTDQNKIYTTDSILPNLNELIANISNQFSTENIDIQPYNVTNQIQSILNNNLNMSDNLQQVVTLASSLLELNDFTTEITSVTLEENLSTSNTITTEQIFTDVNKLSETSIDLTTPDTLTTEKLITTTQNDEIVTDMKPIFLFNPQQATTEKQTIQDTVTSQPTTNKINEKNDEQVTDTTKFSQLEKNKMNISTVPYIQISIEETTLTNNQPLQLFEETTTEIYSTKSDKNITTIKDIETTMKFIENSTEIMEKSTLVIDDETTTEGLTEKTTNEYLDNITQKIAENMPKITDPTTDKMSEANTEENTLFTTEEIIKTTTETTTTKFTDAVEENTTKMPIELVSLKLTDSTTQKTIQVFTENIVQVPIQKTTSTKEDKTTQSTIKETIQVTTEKIKSPETQNTSDILTENTTQDYLIKLPPITTLNSITTTTTTTEKQLETTEKDELQINKLNNTNKQEPYRKTDESYHLNKVSTTDTWKLVQTVLPPNSNEKNNETRSTSTTTEKLNIEMYQPTLKIDMSSQGTFGMPDLSEDIFMFSKLYNELALKFWNALSVNDISADRSVMISPFGAISVLAMIFLGARGGTSGEMNDLLKLDDVVTFNPHLTFKEVTDSIISRKALSAVVRELFTDTNKGRILEFYKGRVKQFYDGHVEEVDFKRINNVIRRRTNSLINKQTRGQMPQYLEETTLHLRAPLSALSTNIFQADCSEASTEGRDGELYFIVLPSLRQRRLVPLPAAVWRSGFIAGYDPELDATAVSLGSTNQVISTIFVIPGQQGHSAPGDVLLRLEARLLNTTYIPETWTQLLRSMLPRPGLEIQLPRFLHKSVINSTAALKRLGLKELFQMNKANLQGLNGIAHDLYFSDLVQVNEFSICGETQQMHTEIYPSMIEYLGGHNEHMRNFKYMDYLEEYDYDKYLSIPLPLRPRQARLPELPRLRFDRPFLFFVRHNPTGLLLHMGRFNPRLMT